MSDKIYRKDCVILVQLIENQKKSSQALKFLASPYFGKDPKSIALFKSILEGLKKKILSEEVLWKRIIGPQKTFSEGYFRVLLSRLQEKLERFLAYQEFENDQFTFQVKKVAGLEKVNWPEKAIKRLNRLKEDQSSTTSDEQDIHYEKYFLSVLEHNISRKLEGFGHWKQVSSSWDFWSCKNWLQVFLHSTNIHQLEEKETNPNSSFTHLIDLANALFPNDPVINVHVSLLSMLSNWEAVRSEPLSKIVSFLKKTPQWKDSGQNDQETGYQLNKMEWQSLFIYTFNITNKEIKSGREDLFVVAANLYETAYIKGLLVNKGSMRASHFFNYVNYHIRASPNNHHQVSKFVETNIEKLAPDQKKHCYGIAMASIAMTLGNDEQARIILNGFRTENHVWEAQRRWMVIKLSYQYLHPSLEQEEEKKTLRRLLNKWNDFPNDRKIIYTTFLDLLDQLDSFDDSSTICLAIDEAQIPDKRFFRELVKKIRPGKIPTRLQPF